MQEAALIRDILILLLTAFAGGFIMRRLKLPTLLGYLLGGLALGSVLPEFILRREALTAIGEIGIAFLLFTLGVELSFDKLRKVGKAAVLGSLLQIILLGLFAMLFLPTIFGIAAQEGLFLGVVFSLSSTAVVAKILSDQGEIDTAHGELLIAWLLVQDLAVVPILIFLPIFLTTQTYDGAFFLSIGAALAKSVVIIFATYLLGRKVLTPLVRRVFSDLNRELFLLLVVLTAICSTFVFTLLGLPGSVGAFLAGLIISGRASSHVVFSHVRPFRDIFSAIFFVLLGAAVSLTFVLENLSNVLLIGVFEMLIVFLTTIFILSAFRLHAKTIFLTAIGLFSVGEFAFVVSGAFFSQRLITQEIYSLVISISLLSLLLSPWQIQAAPKMYAALKSWTKKNPALHKLLFGRLNSDEQLEGPTLTDHVIICGYGRVGREIGEVLSFAQIPFIVVDFNRILVGRLKTRGISALYGDPSEADLLELAGGSRAKAVLIALPDRYSQELIIRNALKLNPKILIICRSHNDADRIPLLSIGANSIVQPEFEAGLAMARQTLVAFNKHTTKVEEYIKQLKRGLEI